MQDKVYPKRTIRQNKALHVLFALLAQTLNDNGMDMRKTLKPGVEIPWSGRSVKEYLWRPVMKAQLNKASTTELTTVEIDQVFDTITRHIGEQFGLSVPFPSIETTLQDLEAERLARKEREKIFEDDYNKLEEESRDENIKINQ